MALQACQRRMRTCGLLPRCISNRSQALRPEKLQAVGFLLNFVLFIIAAAIFPNWILWELVLMASSLFTSSHPSGFNLDQVPQYCLLQQRSILPRYELQHMDCLLQSGSAAR